MELALSIALVILSIVLIALVIVQGRMAGLQSRDSSSIYRTKRGLELTIYRATIVTAVLYLFLALLASLPLFGTTQTPAGLILLAGLA